MDLSMNKLFARDRFSLDPYPLICEMGAFGQTTFEIKGAADHRTVAINSVIDLNS